MRLGLRFFALGALALALSGQQAIALKAGSVDQPERALYFFQESAEANGQVYDGTVEWSETSHSGAPAILAVAHLPDQGVTVNVLIYRNADRSLPATHLIEISLAGDLAASPIQSIPGIARRANEAAPSDHLVGIAVAVTESQFWIALSDDNPHVEVENLQHLRHGFWFDIPILFRNGSQAMITLERGEAGAEIFDTVLSAWEEG